MTNVSYGPKKHLPYEGEIWCFDPNGSTKTKRYVMLLTRDLSWETYPHWWVLDLEAGQQESVGIKSVNKLWSKVG